MASELLVTSAFVGVIMAAAVGPIWMLCFRRALVDGFWSGFASGLGAAGADALYAAVAAFGLTFELLAKLRNAHYEAASFARWERFLL